MDTSTFLLLLCCVFALVTSDQEFTASRPHSYIKNVYAKRHDHLRDQLKKLEKYCPGMSDKLDESFVEYSNCIDKIDDSLTLCGMAETYLNNCSLPFFKSVDHCVPEESKGLPPLFTKSLFSVIDFLCKQTGESLLELFNPCLWNDVKNPDKEMKECEKEVSKMARNYDKIVPEATKVCRDLTHFKKCVKSRVTKSCVNPTTREAFLGFYNAIVAPCKNLKSL